MRGLIVIVAALVAWNGAAQETRSASRPESGPTRLAKVEALRQEIEALRAKFEEAADKLDAESRPEDADTLQKLAGTFQDSARKIGGDLLSIAQDSPKDPVAVAAVRVALMTGLDERQLKAALSVLGEHVGNEAIADVFPALGGYGDKPVEALIQKVLEQNPDRHVKGLACLQLAMRTRARAAHERLLERLISEFADIPIRDDTLGSFAERRLFALRNLQVGMKAPDITGKDMDGVAMKLSDFRGKVVLLDFWGFW